MPNPDWGRMVNNKLLYSSKMLTAWKTKNKRQNKETERGRKKEWKKAREVVYIKGD